MGLVGLPNLHACRMQRQPFHKSPSRQNPRSSQAPGDFKPALTSGLFFGLAASTVRLGQSARSAPGEDDIGTVVSLRKAIPPNNACFEMMIGTHPDDGNHAEIPGALRAHEGFSLQRRDRFDFNEVVAEPAVVPLGVPPTQLHTVPDRCIQLADPTPKCRTFPSLLLTRQGLANEPLEFFRQRTLLVSAVSDFGT
jgi:hypothetical protein